MYFLVPKKQPVQVNYELWYLLRKGNTVLLYNPSGPLYNDDTIMIT